MLLSEHIYHVNNSALCLNTGAYHRLTVMEVHTISHALYPFTLSFGLLIISVEADPNIHWVYTPSEVLQLLSSP